LVLLVVGFSVHLPALTNRSYNSDEAYLATQAQVLNRGGRLYVETVDRKPPVVPYLYAAVFRVTGSDGLLGVHVLAVLASVLSAWLLAVEARRRCSARVGLYAALLFLAGSAALFAKDVQTANFEVFMVPTMIASVVLALRRRPLAAGVVLAVSILTKQTAMFTLLPVAWILWHATSGLLMPVASPEVGDTPHIGSLAMSRDTRPIDAPSLPRGARLLRARLRLLGWLGIGVVAPIAIAAGGFGAHEFFRWVFTGNEGYLDIKGVFWYSMWLGFFETTIFVVANLAVVVLAARAWRRRREDVDLWLWVVAGLVGVASGFRFFGHYYLQLLPPLCLLAAGSMVHTSRRMVMATAAICVGAVVYFAVPPLLGVESQTDRVADALARYTRTHTRPDQRILVWGHLPEVYWLSDRPPATRFETTGFLDGQSGGRPPDRVGARYGAPGAWDDFDADLAAHPPVLIFELSAADVRNAAYSPPSRFPEFAAFLDREYRKIATVLGVAVYAPK
jgi:hypothetical protein